MQTIYENELNRMRLH